MTGSSVSSNLGGTDKECMGMMVHSRRFMGEQFDSCDNGRCIRCVIPSGWWFWLGVQEVSISTLECLAHITDKSWDNIVHEHIEATQDERYVGCSWKERERGYGSLGHSLAEKGWERCNKMNKDHTLNTLLGKRVSEVIEIMKFVYGTSTSSL